MARVFGEIYHASGVNRELRNKLLREWSEEGSIDMSWLYGQQPELPLCRQRADAAAHDFGLPVRSMTHRP